jgi:hypothetical protein
MHRCRPQAERLIMLGVVAFVYQGITYTTREKVIDLGPLQATVDTKRPFRFRPSSGDGHSRRRCVADQWSQKSVARRRASPGMLHIIGPVSMHRAL